MNFVLTPLAMMVIKLVAPIMVALTCIFILSLHRKKNKEIDTQMITKVLMLQLTSCVVSWLCSILFWGATNLFVYVQWLFVPSMLYSQILTYRYIFIHTVTKSDERFSLWHYFWPVVPAMLFFVSIFIYPQSEREYIVSVRPSIKESPLFYNLIIQTVPIVFLLTNITYSAFSMYRISRYRKVIVNFSADESRTSLIWLKWLVYITLSSIPLGLVTLIFGTGLAITLFLAILGVTAVILKGVIPIHNIVNREYVLMYFITEQMISQTVDSTDKKTSVIKVETFERYMRSKKPYLNPDLRITDLLEPLGTNRTYLSTFINSQYNVNFSRYINNLRLKELEHRRKLPENVIVEEVELIEQVGFRNYRNYMNFKQEEEKRSVIIQKEHTLP